MAPSSSAAAPPGVVELCAALLRIDTSNPGATEEPAAALVVDTLERAGCAVEVVEPAPGRCSVIGRLAGREPNLPALVVHGHTDVVPAVGDGWARDPFGGEIADGCVWGRGALDMKGTVAMMLAAHAGLAAERRQPRRDVIFAYFADEEQGGRVGARWIVEHRPDLFAGAGEAIGEIGGFGLTLPGGRRLYPIQTGERGASWAHVTVPGRAGHAAAGGGGIDCVARVARLIEEIGALRLTGEAPVATALLAQAVAELIDCAPDDRVAIADALGTSAALLVDGDPLLRCTVVSAGNASSPNVVPGEAHLHVDCRFLPGGRDAVIAALRAVLDPDMTLEVADLLGGVLSPSDAPLLDICAAAIRAEDPEAVVAPFVLPGSSDGSHLARLGIAGYGFSPLVLPAGAPYLELFHAVDERVPVDALRRGAKILEHVLREY